MDSEQPVTGVTDVTDVPLNQAVLLDALLDSSATANRALKATLAEVRTVKFLTAYTVVLLGILIYRQRLT